MLKAGWTRRVATTAEQVSGDEADDDDGGDYEDLKAACSSAADLKAAGFSVVNGPFSSEKRAGLQRQWLLKKRDAPHCSQEAFSSNSGALGGDEPPQFFCSLSVTLFGSR